MLNATNEMSELEKEEANGVEYKTPSFLLIDDREGGTRQTYYGSDGLGQPQEAVESEGEKSSISLRFLCFLGLIACVVFGLLIFIGAIALSVLALGSFFRNSQLNQGVCNLWMLCLHSIVSSVGFLIGIVSPTIGLGLVVFYFSIIGKA